MRFRNVMWAGLVAGVCWLLPVRAQPLSDPVPLSPLRFDVSPAAISATLASAQRAHNFGQFSVAETYYRRLLQVEGVDQSPVKLALASVLLDAGNAAEAKAVLDTMPAPRTAAWQLRYGLAAFELRNRDAAQAAWDAINPAELTSSDRAWHVFLEAALYDWLPTPNITKANELYRNAEAAAETEVSRARFQLAAEKGRLRLEAPSPERLEGQRQLAESRRGTDLGYENDRLYAVMLVQVNRKADALTYLNDLVLRNRPGPARDDFNFLIGLIGERGRDGMGRNALFQLLQNGTKPERQRQALELLAAASATGPERAQLRVTLDRLIALPTPHPVKETLLYFRAQQALVDREYVTAESDADQLLRDFPASRLRPHAFAILTESAWDQQRYRRAAVDARRAREALLPESAPGSSTARVRAALGIFEAEAHFRAGQVAERLEGGNSPGKADFSAAADAYAALLRERPPELDAKKLGELMYQCVLAGIKAGSPDAEKKLDEFENDPAFDLENRWNAEWSLARAAKARNDIAAAYARVNRLLAEGAPGAATLPVSLRAKMAWLQASLSFDDRQPEKTLLHAEGLLASLTGLEEWLYREIASTVLLLKAQAELALDREPAALQTFAKLRSEFAQTEAAIESYLIHADHYAAQGKVDVAQRTLTALVDNRNYSASPAIPRALLRLAELSQQLGSEANLRAANNRIEELLHHPLAADDIGLIFRARLKQGNIFQLLNEYPRAQQAYDDLLNKYPQRPEAAFAQLESARSYNAQSASDRRNAEIAKAKFEELFYRRDVDPAVRVEAGYNLGLLFARLNKPDEAALIWWGGLGDEVDKLTPLSNPSANLVYWLGKALLDYGELQEKRDKFSDAKNAYQLILKKNLDANTTAVARDRLKQMGVPAP